MALFVLRKLIIQTHMRSHPVGLDIWFLVWPFFYFQSSCVRTAKAVARLQMCRLAWAIAGRLCDKYQNLKSWLKGMLHSDSKEKGQILVEQFYTVFTKMGNRVSSKLLKQFSLICLDLTITAPGVEKLLQKINTSKAIGLDNIWNVILKQCTKQLSPGLSKIFQTSVDIGELPLDWTNANISPACLKRVMYILWKITARVPWRQLHVIYLNTGR